MINLVKDYVTPEEAANLLSVHKNTLINMVKEGKLKPVRSNGSNGGHRRYSIYELANYIKYLPDVENTTIVYLTQAGEQEFKDDTDYVTLVGKDNRLKDSDVKKLVRLIVTRQVKCLILQKANIELYGLKIICELCKYYAVTVQFKE